MNKDIPMSDAGQQAYSQCNVIGSPSSVVYNMDCIEGMKQYPDKYFDLAICDPPYGIGMDGTVGIGIGTNKGFTKKSITKKKIGIKKHQDKNTLMSFLE